MPKATINTTSTKHDLVSAPPDGFVELKRRSYGDSLERRDIMMTLGIKGEGKDAESAMKLQNRAVTAFEWAKSITGWNLVDENDVQLDWHKANIFDIIDPFIATEITQAIADMHAYENELGK